MRHKKSKDVGRDVTSESSSKSRSEGKILVLIKKKFTVFVMRIIKRSTLFYIKILLAYGFLLAFLYCPSMLNEQKYGNIDQFDVADKISVDLYGDMGEKVAESGYPYARMMNLIEQCNYIDSKYHKYISEFNQNRDIGVKKLKKLHSKIYDVLKSLYNEKKKFADYSSASRFKNDVLMDGGKHKDLRYLNKIDPAKSRKYKNNKARRRVETTLSGCVIKMKTFSQGLTDLIKKAKIEAEEAKKKLRSTTIFD